MPVFPLSSCKVPNILQSLQKCLNHTDTLVSFLSAERNVKISRTKVGATSEGKVLAPKERAAEAANAVPDIVSMMKTMMAADEGATPLWERV